MTKFSRKLTYFQRNAKNLPGRLRDNARPPRNLFENHPDALAEYDTLATLSDAVRTHYRGAATKKAAAVQAAKDYQAEVQAAMVAGQDPSKIKNKAPLFEAEAEAHAKFADQATGKVTRQAGVAGESIKAIAHELFDQTEADMVTSAAEVAAMIDALRAALTGVAEAWTARQWLSNMHHLGGTQAWPGVALAPEVEHALTVISSTLANVDALKDDEQTLEAWRAEQVSAQSIVRGLSA